MGRERHSGAKFIAQEVEQEYSKGFRTEKEAEQKKQPTLFKFGFTDPNEEDYTVWKPKTDSTEERTGLNKEKEQDSEIKDVRSAEQ